MVILVISRIYGWYAKHHFFNVKFILMSIPTINSTGRSHPPRVPIYLSIYRNWILKKLNISRDRKNYDVTIDTKKVFLFLLCRREPSDYTLFLSGANRD